MTDDPQPSVETAMSSDCGDSPCPEPQLAKATPEQTAALTDGVRMRQNPAEWAFVRLSKLIEDFEKSLNPDQEIAARVVGLPGDGLMQIDDIGFWGPDLILFLGKTPEGKAMRLIQHYAQINVVLEARQKPNDQAQARRIGFQLSELVRRTNPSD